MLLTSAHANVTNVARYAQQAVDLGGGRLHLEAGLRYDYSRFNVQNGINETPTETNLFSGVRGSSRFQPKASAAYTVSDRAGQHLGGRESPHLALFRGPAVYLGAAAEQAGDDLFVEVGVVP